MSTSKPQGEGSAPKQPENPNSPRSDASEPPKSDLPMGNLKFTSFVEVKPIIFPRGMTSSEDEDGNPKRKPHGWYPNMTEDEDEKPARKKKKTRQVASTSAPGQSARNPTVKWTEEEDTFTLETWAEWPECTYNELVELLNAKFGNGRTVHGLRWRYAGMKGWLLERLKKLSEPKDASSA